MRLMVLLSVFVAACGMRDPGATPRVEWTRDAEVAIVRGGAADTWQSLAADYLGSARHGWLVAETNAPMASPANRNVVVPIVAPNPVGVFPDGFQTVPVLCYHRFTRGPEDGKLALSEARFAEQMRYLAENGYQVISFADFRRFVDGAEPVPPRSVIISIDDGYRSAYEIAYPILRRHGFPATIFVYTDFIGASAALTWSQMAEMLASGLIDIQPHSKSHANLVLVDASSGPASGAALAREIVEPTDLLRRRLEAPMHTFSYPYGATNDRIVRTVEETGLALAATVHRGANPAFASPYRLKRAQIYATHDMRAFVGQLDVFQQADLQ